MWCSWANAIRRKFVIRTQPSLCPSAFGRQFCSSLQIMGRKSPSVFPVGFWVAFVLAVGCWCYLLFFTATTCSKLLLSTPASAAHLPRPIPLSHSPQILTKHLLHVLIVGWSYCWWFRVICTFLKSSSPREISSWPWSCIGFHYPIQMSLSHALLIFFRCLMLSLERPAKNSQIPISLVHKVIWPSLFHLLLLLPWVGWKWD